MTPAARKTTPRATIHPHLARSTFRPSARLWGPELSAVIDMPSSFSAKRTHREYTRSMTLSPVVWEAPRFTETTDTNERLAPQGYVEEGTGPAAPRHHHTAAETLQARRHGFAIGGLHGGAPS